MFGAIADGASHKLTAEEIVAHETRWVGKYEIGDEWDYVGLQEAIYAAFDSATAKPNGADATHNRELSIPPGNYIVNKPPTITEVHGGTITGAGRHVSVITSTYPGPAFQTNGCWYTQFTGITFAGRVPHDGAVFELDGNYDGTHKQGVQGNTFKDCYFDAEGKVSKAFALVRRGGNNAQGSENLFLNCHFQAAIFAGVYIAGFNALQNTFIGGNIQDCLNGIYVQAGSINVDSMGFQNGFRKQIEHDGFDVVIRNSADDHSSVRNCRSESARLISSMNNHFLVVDNNNLVNGPPNGTWRLLHWYHRGDIVSGVTGGRGDGHLHVAVSAGISGIAEPAWSGAGVLATGQIAADAVELNLRSAAIQPQQASGCGVMVTGAGAKGESLYTTVEAAESATKWRLADKAATAVSNATVRAAPVIDDGGVAWIPYDYDEAIINGPVSVTNNAFKWGRLTFARGEIANNSYARADSFKNPGKLGGELVYHNNFLTLNGGWNTGRFMPSAATR